MKLSRLLSNQNGVSRKQANTLIARGQVTIDDITCRDPAREVSVFEQVAQQGRVIQAGIPAKYLMLNKPAGILSATRDPSHTTVIDLVDAYGKEDLHIAGRLDRATTGLMILTNNGHWSRRLTDPRNKKPKVYEVTTAYPITCETARRFAQGIWFEYERLTTSPALLDIVASNRARLTIYEGRYHQIKRMFHAVGNRVIGLHREKMGAIGLDPKLPAGGYRPLTQEEIQSVTNEAISLGFR
jgi:16S rRNA pseudouridine516 synthase